MSEIFVQLNGARLSATNDEIVAFFLGIADGSVSREEVERLFVIWVELP